MKILIIVPDYPSNNSISFKFVHDRVKEYQKHFDVEVFCYNSNFKQKYNYENVAVNGGSKDVLLNLLQKNNYDRFVFHFFSIKNAKFILKHLKDKQILFWFHGSDCISWKRRIAKLNYTNKKLINPIFLTKLILFISINKIRSVYIKKLNRECKNIDFIFVSEWSKITSEKDLKIKYRNSIIIPNYINFKVFKYYKKTKEDRLNILSINNYANNIYAGDITQEIIKEFSKREEFKYFNFSIYGNGNLFDKYTKDLSEFKNVSIKKGFLKEAEIIEIHKNNGVFLYPKRGDSQGVSRCEAMASGLVPIASDVEAVSEFSPDTTSYLAKEVDDFVNALIRIYYNSEEYLVKSNAGYDFIYRKCNYENTIDKEISLISDETGNMNKEEYK